MASKNIVEVVIKATDKASKKMGGLNKTLKLLGVGAAAAGAAVVAAGVVVGKTAFNLAKESANVEKLKNTFDSLADSIGENSDIMIKDLRVASRGMLNDADLMQASNKLVAMGLADTSEESSKLVEISTQLGTAMGMDATEAAEAFALMLANQSIPRLDNFGISSGVVRDRIAELMEAEEGMTRETAFMTATMEEAEKTMEKVGEQGEGAAANMARLEANVDNLKIEIGNRFLPVLTTITDKLLVMWDDPQIQQGLDNLFDWIEKVVGDEDSGLIGMITLLASGDIEGAFDAVFGKGQGVYKIISGFVDFFDRSFQGIEFAIDTVKTALENIANSPAMNDFINRKSQVENWLGGSTAVGTAAKNVATSKMGRVGGSSRTYYQGGRASGGSVSAGGSYLVGEQGPEVLKMGGNSGYITPNKLGGATIVFNLNSVVSLADMENAKRVLQPIVESGLRTVMAR